MRPFLLALAASLSLAPALAAQRVLGPTLDATTLRKGTLRTTLTIENVLLRGRWNDGASEPLGAGLSVSLDGDRLEQLGAMRALFAGLNRPDVSPTLGRSRVDLRQRLAVTRLGLEYGLTDRITLRAQAPFVRARAEAQLGLDAADASAGLNPMRTGTGVAATNRAVIDAYTNAVASLTQRRDDCVGNPGAHPECGTILAEATQVNAAIARGTQLATALGTIYGAQGIGDGMRYVPLETSVPHVALMGIGIFLQNDFERWGVTDVNDATGFTVGAQAPLTADELARVIGADADSGLGARIPRRSTKQDLGDVDLGVTVQLFDAFAGDSGRVSANRFGLRQSVGITYRLGRGAFDLPDNLTDLGTGSGHDAVALHSYTDVIVNARFWATVTVGWARAATHERVVRVPLVEGLDLIDVDREATVRITPADLLELRLAPRWVINDYLALGAEWRLRSRGRDEVDVLGAGPSLPAGVPLPYGDGGMQTPSDANEQRWAWTLAYSSVNSTARGRARLPLEIAYSHEQSVGSSRGIVPRRWEDRLTLRYYARLLGR